LGECIRARGCFSCAAWQVHKAGPDYCKARGGGCPPAIGGHLGRPHFAHIEAHRWGALGASAVREGVDGGGAWRMLVGMCV
jgi:hypothetical protein